jgi:hypothetical protein
MIALLNVALTFDANLSGKSDRISGLCAKGLA